MNFLKKTYYLPIIFLFFACQTLDTGKKVDFEAYDATRHFQADVSLAKIDTLQSWDYCWEAVGPILKFMGNNGETSPHKLVCLSKGQKALYLYWVLDAELANGGFVQYFWNGYAYQIEPLQKGLSLTNDAELSNLVGSAKDLYYKNLSIFEKSKQRRDLRGLYAHLPEMRQLKWQYDSLQNQSVQKFEGYIRAHQDEFFKIKR